MHESNWYIEGYHVTLQRGEWRISGVPGTFSSLSEARLWIVDELNGVHE